MPPNPYFTGKPVSAERFLGRSTEVKMALDTLSNQGHLAVFGSSGMGKSSLLKLLAAPQAWQERGRDPSQATIIYLNCNGITPFTPEALWREALGLLKEKTDDKTLHTELDQILGRAGPVEKADLRQVLRKLGQQGKFLALLLDDYDAALRPNERYTEAQMLNFLSEFRALAVHTDESQYLSSIVATFRRLNELGPKLAPDGSPWYNQYLFQPLRPFSQAEVDNLLNHLAADSRPSGALRGGICEIAGRSPALLQIACYLLYEAYEAGQPVDKQKFIDDFGSRTRHFFANAWRSSTEVEQVLLILIALARLEGRLNEKRQYKLDGVEIIFSQKKLILDDLKERGLIESTPAELGEHYSFASSIMERWVIQEIENCDDEEIKQREAVFFNLLGRKQAEPFTQVLREVWKHRDTATAVAGWLGKLGALF